MAKKARFRMPDGTATLQFDGAYEGLWVKARLMPEDPRVLMAMANWTELPDVEAAEKFIDVFGQRFLVDWNAEDVNGALPASAEGFARVPIVGQVKIVSKWLETMMQSGAFSGGE